MSFAKSLATVSSLTIVSRLLGFLRDTLTAMYLGAGLEADAFFVAQRLPNLFRSLFAEGAFTSAFVPLYAAESQRHGDDEAQRFAGEALAMLAIALGLFCLIVVLFMPTVIQMIAPGFRDEPEKFNLAVDFSRITFPYLMLISITALQGGVLNARNHFGPAAAAPTALNVVLIAGLFLAHHFNWPMGKTLSWATFISGIVQSLWLFASCRRLGCAIPLQKPTLNLRTRHLFRQIGPGAIGAGAAQINLLLSTILASTLPTGSVAYLYYADRLNQLPLGIVGIAVATTLLPLLARQIAAGNHDSVRHYMSRAIEFCILLGVPATIGLTLGARPIIQTLFEHGAFGAVETAETTKALTAYALGIPAFLLVKVFAASLFARHDTKTPVKFAITAMIVNVACALILLGPLQHVGVALATSIATWTNALLLFRHLHRQGHHFADAALKDRLPRLLIACLGMAVVTALLNALCQSFFETQALASRIAGLSIIIAGSGLVYLALLPLTGAMRPADLKSLLKKTDQV